MEQDKTLILSDLHLAYRKTPTPDLLRPLWRDGGHQHLVLNGDVAEVDRPRFKVQAEAYVQQLKDYTKADGINLIMTAGNHDPSLTDRRTVSLFDERLLLIHGDAFHPKIAPWSKESPVLDRLIQDAESESGYVGSHHLSEGDSYDIQQWFEIINQAMQTYWLEHESTKPTSFKRQLIKKPWFPLKVIYQWHRFPDYATTFLDQYFPQTKCLIYGHIHRAGVKKKAGRLLINTGGFDEMTQPHCAVLDKGQLSLHGLFLKKPQGYQMGPMKHQIDVGRL